jgi:ABC-type arginine/histidine transport system permease subunit
LDPIDLAIEGLGGWGKKKKKSLEIWRLTYLLTGTLLLLQFFLNYSIILLLRFSICVFVCVGVAGTN